MVLYGSSASRRYRRIHDDIGEQELRFISRHKPLEGILLPESPPRVLSDPSFIQCLMTPHLYTHNSLLTYTYVSLQICKQIFIRISVLLWAPGFPYSYAYISTVQCIQLSHVCHFYVLCSLPYSKTPVSISKCTYITVPTDVHIVLIICLPLSYICMFISAIHAYAYSNIYTHLPTLSYSYTSIDIFIVCSVQLFCTCHA